MHDTEKRSSLSGMQATDPAPGIDQQGVGGRQPGQTPGPRGGGYLNICNILKPAVPAAAGDEAMMIADLRAAGLNAQWLDIARVVGYEQFLIVWQLLDQMAARRHARNIRGDESWRLRIPRFDGYLRYQRDLWIRQLGESGLSHSQIRRRLKRHRYDLSERQIARIVASMKNDG